MGTSSWRFCARGGTQYSAFAPAGGLDVGDLVVAELDGQVGDDIAVVYAGLSDHFSVIHGGATLSAYPDVSFPSCQNGFLQAGRFGGANAALVLTCNDRVQLLQATGNGAFVAAAPWPISPLTQKVVGVEPQLADFDGDGDLDIVVLRVEGTLPAELWLLENVDGRGTLMPKQLAGSVVVGPNSAVDVGDVNDDGRPDIVIGDRNPASQTPMTVLFNVSR